MAKYLKEVDLLASKLYDEDLRIEFLENTFAYLKKINEFVHRNINSRYGKVVVMLLPVGKLSDDNGLIPCHEYDEMSDVATIYVEYDLSIYGSETSPSARESLVLDIMKNALLNLPAAYGLDEDKLIGILKTIETKVKNI